MKTALTGIKPTGTPHLGNYLGAIRPALRAAQSEDTKTFLFIADYHSLTSVQDPKLMRQYVYEVASTWLAAGLDPAKTTIYRQSDVPEVFELSWILSCLSPKGLMNRAHAYKAKVQENQESGRDDLDYGVNMGLFTYPLLMSADILAFDADEVPVGEDQVQHIEIARDLAQKFNHQFGDTLKLPKPVVPKTSKAIPGLDGRKMSKSYDNHIPMFLEAKKMRSLVMKIKTDSSPPEAPKDPATSILFELYQEFATSEETAALRARYEKGVGWGEVKQQLFDVIDRHISPMRERYNQLIANPGEIDGILSAGASKARAVASDVLTRVRRGIGIAA